MKIVPVTLTRYFKTLFLFFVLVCMGASNTYAQESVKNEILNYKDTVATMITNGRKLMTEKVLRGDVAKVKQIKDYLEANVANNEYMIFYPSEYQLILYRTMEYNRLLYMISHEDSVLKSAKRQVRPETDLLYRKVYNTSYDMKQELRYQVTSSTLPEADKDFLLLNLEYTLLKMNGGMAKKDTLNKKADAYLAKYPGNSHEAYVKKNMRNEYTTSPWGIGFEFFSGYGRFTGNVANSYSGMVPVGVAFDIQYRSFVLYLRDFIGIGKTKQDIPYSAGIWPRHSQANTYLPEASIGYVVMEDKRLKIAPFAGISSTAISSTTHDEKIQPALEDAGLGFSMTYTVGLNAEFNLGSPKGNTAASAKEKNNWFVRVRYAFNMPRFEQTNPGFSGNLHYITVGIGGFASAARKRK